MTDRQMEQRNRLVAWLAAIYPSTLARTDIEGWDEAWHWCCFIETPAGQVSFHLHDSQLHLFEHVDRADGERWDGHDDDEKWRRVQAALDDEISRQLEEGRR